MSFLRNIFKTRSKDWIFQKLEDSQTPPDSLTESIEINENYIEIWLKSLRIVDVRKGLSKFHPVAHSFISIPYFGSIEPAEFNMVTKPGKLEELNSNNIDRVISVNKQMLDKIPYRGGNIDLDIGLYSIKSQDLAGPYLTLLEDISSKAGVSFVNQALQFAEPLKTGINLLTGGGDDSIFEIGLSTTFEGVNLKTGYYVVIRSERNDLDPLKLSVSPDNFKLLYEGDRVEDYPYLVFEIKKSVRKQIWWNEVKIQEGYKEIEDAYNRNNQDDLYSAFKQFQRIVQLSPNLIEKDKQRVKDEVKERLGLKNTNAIATAGKENKKLPLLSEYEIYN